MNSFMTNSQMAALHKHLVKKCPVTKKPSTLILNGSLKVSRTCDHTLKKTLAWMIKNHIPNIRGNIARIYDLGGHCDCEVVHNVVDVWHKEKDGATTGPDYLDDGWIEWNERIDTAIFIAGGWKHTIPGWDSKVIHDRDEAIKNAVNALKDRHVIVDVDDVVEELRAQNVDIEISRNYIAGELDANCPVQRAVSEWGMKAS